MGYRYSLSACLVVIVAALFSGCGNESSTSPKDENPIPMATLALNPEPCKATFTEDYTVFDVFGDEQFKARAGDSFMVKDEGGIFGAQLYYLLEKGAYEFDVDKKTNNQYPFTSNCATGETSTYLAAFQNTTVYSDSLLTQPICTLTKGATAPAGLFNGYYLVGDFFSNIYHVELGGFASQCQGAEGGYVRAPEANVFGASTTLIPINSYQAQTD